MAYYQYTGEHHTLTIENIRFVKGEQKHLSDTEEKTLLASGFGKAIIASGELVKLDDGEQANDDGDPKDSKAKKARAKLQTNEPKTEGETQGDT